MRRVLLVLLILYLLVKAVDVTATHPEILPLSQRWVLLVGAQVAEDVRWGLEQLAVLRNLQASQPADQSERIMPPLAGLDQPTSIQLLEQMGITDVNYQVIPSEYCRQPGRVVATLPDAGAQISAGHPVAVFMCEDAERVEAKQPGDAEEPPTEERSTPMKRPRSTVPAIRGSGAE